MGQLEIPKACIPASEFYEKKIIWGYRNLGERSAMSQLIP